MTIRTRLTLLYAGLFLAAGVLLLGVNATLFRHKLSSVKSSAEQRLLQVAHAIPPCGSPYQGSIASPARRGTRSIEVTSPRPSTI